MKRVHVRITGKVQGVWFRQSTMDEAVRLGLGGWVRNRADGSVEAVFEGPGDKVDAMLEWCWRGPELAVVKNVAVTGEESTEKFTSFDLRAS